MKIGDQVIEGDLAAPNQDVLVLPRSTEQIVFTAEAIMDQSDLDNYIKEPEPTKVFHKGKGWIANVKDKEYIRQMTHYGKLRVAYFVVKSLEPSKIEWDNVDLEDHNTWSNWEDDLKNNGFTQHECNLILGLCFRVNQLDERKLEQARQLFVLGQERSAGNSSSQNTEQNSTPSGEPANDSE
jgi:hypothetical protein